MEIEYLYMPEEARTHDYPGCDPEVEVYGDEQFMFVWRAMSESAKTELEQGIIAFEQEKAKDAAEYNAESRREALEEGSVFYFGVGLVQTLDKLIIRREDGRE